MRKYVAWIPILGLGGLLFILACGDRVIKQRAPLDYVQGELEKLAPVTLECDLSRLNGSDMKVLTRLIEAGRIIDELFLLQVDPDNAELKAALQTSGRENDEYYLELFNIMFGPWNRLDEDKPFLNRKAKPAGVGYYPDDMTKQEFLTFVEDNPGLKKDFESNFTVIRRRENDSLVAIPYHEQYQSHIQQISRLLCEAAGITEDPTLAKYLELRARDLLTDDYFDSDMAWMDLAGDLEIVIGPYEVYEDKLFSYKAAYEAFICVVDHEESRKLAEISRYLNDMEAYLPIPDEYKNFERGSYSPIKVVNEIFSAGDTKAGIQTTAFNLPNDERVREAKGSKKVMLKNIARAKFEQCWIPIVNRILAEKPLKQVSFEAYFNQVLMHEISHGLGPGFIKTKDGNQTTVSKELRELYPLIEECKADVLGIYNVLFLMDRGILPQEQRYSALASYLGGMFRSIRFGISEAHGGGVAIQFNYYMDRGAFYQNEEGKLELDSQKLEVAIESLANRLLLIQARGDYEAARELVEDYRVMTPVMAIYIEELEDVPIDIRPSYPVLGQ